MAVSKFSIWFRLLGVGTGGLMATLTIALGFFAGTKPSLMITHLGPDPRTPSEARVMNLGWKSVRVYPEPDGCGKPKKENFDIRPFGTAIVSMPVGSHRIAYSYGDRLRYSLVNTQ